MLTDDFLCHYVMGLRASPVLVGPTASAHTPGYERTGNWPVGHRVTPLGIYINISVGRTGAGGGDLGCPHAQCINTDVT